MRSVRGPPCTEHRRCLSSTLFNLQGTNLFICPSRFLISWVAQQLMIISHSFSFVKNFFQFFWNLFSTRTLSSSRCDGHSVYHTCLRLSRPFSTFLKSFPDLRGPTGPPLSRCFASIPNTSSKVNPFFSFFSSFFSFWQIDQNNAFFRLLRLVFLPCVVSILYIIYYIYVNTPHLHKRTPDGDSLHRRV